VGVPCESAPRARHGEKRDGDQRAESFEKAIERRGIVREVGA